MKSFSSTSTMINQGHKRKYKQTPTGRQVSPTMPIKTQSNWVAGMLTSHQSFCLSISLSLVSSVRVSLHLTHKPADEAHCAYIPPFGSSHTDTQGSPSVGQRKTVAMAAHPEPCCRMIRGVMLLNQPPFFALHCCLCVAT